MAEAEAVLLDFYGTVVHEDDVVIDQICKTISQTAGAQATPNEIGSCWWATFSDAFGHSHGDNFQTQRRLELAALAQTINNFDAHCDADELTEPLFAHWERPPIFEDATRFLAGLDLPVVVLSNIDRVDIETAIAHHNLTFDHVITSEDVRSYKPRPELFLAGLEAARCPPDRVLHVGDSLTSDVAGARQLGIPVAWINRAGKPPPKTHRPTYEMATLEDLLASVLT
ncbi:MAG: HAD family hydrolase [Lentisphaerae bacterium]|nr:HAD family hydrolase [Lentisphaerota bacterium]